MAQGQDWNAPAAQEYQTPYQEYQTPYQQYQTPYQEYQTPYQPYPPAGIMPGPGYGAPAQAPAGLFYDQLSGLTIPEGTQVASAGRRIGSYFLAIPLIIVTLGIGYLIWGAITWSRGQTPTQSLLGLQTWKPQTGMNTTWGEQSVREVSRVVYIIPFIGWLVAVYSFATFVSGNQHRTLHDSMGGTVVLYDPNRVLQRVAAQPPQTW